MYTEKELKAASDIIRRIAREHNIPEKRVRADIKEAMNAGIKNPCPTVQARLADFHYSGTEPGIEEFILWAAAITVKRMRDL